MKQELIGRKVKGFKFDGHLADCGYNPKMDNYINQIGVIESCNDLLNSYYVEFKDDKWQYPAELIEQHLVDESGINPLDNLPIIGEGVLMEVSDNGQVKWHEAEVYCKIKESYIAKLKSENFISEWGLVRPITPKRKITRAEFESKYEIID